MTKFGKILIFGILVVVIAMVTIVSIWFLNPKRKIDNETRKTIGRQETNKAKAIDALYSLVAVADSASGIKSLKASKFKIVDMNGMSANFGISKSDGVRSENIVEKNVIIFQSLPMDENFPKTYKSEVDIATNKVVSMHREPVYTGDKKSTDELEKIVRQFIGKAYPDFTRIESTLESSSGSKGKANSFFRWEDIRFALPQGLEMDLPPLIQVGITSNGYIFSYNNTIQPYSNLSKEALRAICAFVKIPKTDDSSLDSEKGIVKVWFSEYNPFQNKYLVLPYEPKTDFEGCSESAKTYLKHLPNELDKN